MHLSLQIKSKKNSISWNLIKIYYMIVFILTDKYRFKLLLLILINFKKFSNFKKNI